MTNLEFERNQRYLAKLAKKYKRDASGNLVLPAPRVVAQDNLFALKVMLSPIYAGQIILIWMLCIIPAFFIIMPFFFWFAIQFGFIK